MVSRQTPGGIPGGPVFGDAAYKNVGTVAGTVAAGDDSRLAAGGNASLLTSGTLPDARLNNVGTAGTYGSSTQVPVITTDGKGRVTGVSLATVSGGGGGGPANTDALPEGTTNLYYTTARARGAISATGSLSYNATSGVLSYAAPTLATVATTGSYADLSGKPTLGTAAAQNTGISAGNVVQVQTGGKLPILDGSNLTNIAASGGTLVYLGETAISTAVATVDITAPFAGALYDRYIVAVEGVARSASFGFELYFYKGGTLIFPSGTSIGARTETTTSTVTAANGSANSGFQLLSSASFASGAFSGTIDIVNVKSTARQSVFSRLAGDTVAVVYDCVGTQSDTGTLTGIQFRPASGNLTAGKFRLWGVKAS